MNTQKSYPCCGITRRGFLLGAVTAGVPLGWLAWHNYHKPFTGRSAEVARPALAMPGPFPGRVVEVRHPYALNARHEPNPATVAGMMRTGMCSLVGSPDVDSAWQRFFEPGDVVGIKLNPVGRKRNLPVPDAISSPVVIRETVRCLHEYAGIPKRNIILFERYADEFREAGYETMMRQRGFEDVRWHASSYSYDEEQLTIDGQNPDPRKERDPHVVGYDPDVYVSMGFCAPSHDRHDDRRFRSHLSMIVTRMVNKIITIPNLKDHKSAGVTIALKNMSHGMNNNVCRSHIPSIYRLGGGLSMPNQCNTFIPTAVAQRPLMEKATLHICDGLIGVYEGGPGNWNRTWGYWPRQSLFFATDPVAMDHVGWNIIDAKRAEMGWRPVGQMGIIQGGQSMRLSPNQVVMAATTPPFGTVAMLLEQERQRRILSGEFDRRQPEHVALAGLLGLGRFDRQAIDHHVVSLG